MFLMSDSNREGKREDRTNREKEEENQREKREFREKLIALFNNQVCLIIESLIYNITTNRKGKIK